MNLSSQTGIPVRELGQCAFWDYNIYIHKNELLNPWCKNLAVANCKLQLVSHFCRTTLELTDSSMLKLGLTVFLNLSEVGVFGKAKRIEVTDRRQGAWKTVAELGLLVVNIYWQNASTKHIVRLCL